MNRIEKAYLLFGDNMKFLEGNRTKRMHVYVDKKANEKVREGCEKLGLSISEYVLYTAFSFDASRIAKSLNVTLSKVNKMLKDANITCKIKSKGVRTMKENTKNTEMEVRSEQLHLRVTPEAHDEIKRRATALSMSISDYIVFTTTHFDIMDIAKKVDEINQKLDVIEQHQRG